MVRNFVRATCVVEAGVGDAGDDALKFAAAFDAKVRESDRIDGRRGVRVQR